MEAYTAYQNDCKNQNIPFMTFYQFLVEKNLIQINIDYESDYNSENEDPINYKENK